MPEDKTFVFRVNRQFKARLLLAVLALLVCLAGIFYLGRLNGLGSSVELLQRNRELLEQVDSQKKAISNDRREIVRLQKAAEVDRLAAEVVRQDVLTYRQEAADLQRDVEFYRGLMAPDELQRGLRLHSFEIAPAALAGQYTFRAVMTNIGGNGNVVKGGLQIAMAVTVEGQLKELLLSELPDYQGVMPIKLRFRFFQNIEGAFKLPANYQPVSITVSSDIKDAAGETFQASYNWAELTRSLSEGDI